VGGDAKAVAWRQPLCGGKVSKAAGIVENELALVHDVEETANLV
jgi:hypothetical protein